MECGIRFAWIILLYILLKFVTVDAIVLSKGPEDKTIYEGDTVTFECIVANEGTSQILWVFGGKHFISAGNRILTYSDLNGFNKRCKVISSVGGQYKLQISNVSKSDEGVFECYYTRNRATKNFGIRGGARLTVLTIGTNTPICGAHTSDPPLRPNQNIVLNCTSASQDFVIKWDNGSSPLTEFQHGRQVIKIVLTPFDNGRVFTCTEINPANYKTRNCSIKPMNILPIADIFPRKPEITVNMDITFECNASGLPSIVKYKWTHDGYVIAQGDYFPMKYQLGENGRRLTIHGVDMIDDQSTIVCHAYVPSGLHNSASTTMAVKALPVYHFSTKAPLPRSYSTPKTTDRTTELIREDDGHKHIRSFILSLPAVVASVIAICVVIIISVSLLMLACHQKPKSILDLPDITARRGRSPGTFIPSVSGGISHNNFIYAELSNEINFMNISNDEYMIPSLHEDDILEPLLDGNNQPFQVETHTKSGLVAPPLPPKPTRLIAPDLYTEIPDEVCQRNEQPSPACDDDMFYCGTELSVRSSSETTDNVLPEPDEIYYQIPDRTSLVIVPEISEYCHSKITRQWSHNPSPCGCDEQSRTTCPSYARVKKGNKTHFGLGNLERRLLIPLKCDDLTSAELYDIHTPLLDFNTEQEIYPNECYSDQFYNAIPDVKTKQHHTMMLPTRRPSRRCRSRLRRSKSCPKNNPYDDFSDDLIHSDSFVSNLRVAESAPNLIQTQACNSRRRHIYETVPDKIIDKLHKAKSDDILSKGSSDISYGVDSSEYMDMESSDINHYI